MREIEFRGKKEVLTEENKHYCYNGWVYSDCLYKCDDGVFLLPNGVSAEAYHIRPYNFRANSDLYEICVAKIKAETLGQYTGLKDKNGTKIFEGDIVKVYSDCDGYYTKKQYLNGIILFDEEYFFEYEISFNHIRCCCEENIGKHRDNIEVIGNIYDNKELLGENDE